MNESEIPPQDEGQKEQWLKLSGASLQDIENMQNALRAEGLRAGMGEKVMVSRGVPSSLRNLLPGSRVRVETFKIDGEPDVLESTVEAHPNGVLDHTMEEGASGPIEEIPDKHSFSLNVVNPDAPPKPDGAPATVGLDLRQYGVITPGPTSPDIAPIGSISVLPPSAK